VNGQLPPEVLAMVIGATPRFRAAYHQLSHELDRFHLAAQTDLERELVSTLGLTLEAAVTVLVLLEGVLVELAP
jgi:hypothetical protein